MQAEPLPRDYVDCAERVIGQHSGITTSKLRNLLSQFVDAYNRETLRTEETLTQESMDALTMARIRILYEAGRDNNVKSFVEAAKLLPYLKDIRDSRDKLIQYYHYLEALVAYQKFYGGKEN
ncbi:MAG: type III-A CRISPR-associated protein Csm2 [Oscillospiraceae bacterium]|nr:type III-A CRISPR-associated protein Csm2 [Oscillospiraceae bacterium]